MESEDIKFSFVMVSYNPKKEWIENAWNSARGLFDQYVLVDDHSAIPIPMATVTHETNKGCGDSRNTGISLCTGEWIASLDDDDELIRQNVEKLKEFARKTDADIIHFPIEFFGEASGIYGVNPNVADTYNSNQIPSNSWYRKSVWEKLKGYQVKSAEDWDFWCRAYKHQMKFVYFPLVIYKHRVRGDSVSAGWNGDKLQTIKKEVHDNYAKEQV